MGNPVVHWELWSQDPEGVSDFYAKAFGWEMQNIPELNYRMVETGGVGGIKGGIMKPEDGAMPGNMTFYIQVDDLAESRDKVVAAGGNIVVEHMDVPGVGSFSLFADPDGRVIGLWKQMQE